jgi:hypothetical protein
MTKLQFTPQFTLWLTSHLAQIVVEPAIEDYLFLLLPLEDPFPPREVNIGGCNIADPFMVEPIIVILDELCCAQSFRLREHQQIQLGLDGLIEPFQLAFGLRMIRRRYARPGAFASNPPAPALGIQARGHSATGCVPPPAPAPSAQHSEFDQGLPRSPNTSPPLVMQVKQSTQGPIGGSYNGNPRSPTPPNSRRTPSRMKAGISEGLIPVKPSRLRFRPVERKSTPINEFAIEIRAEIVGVEIP